MVNGPKVIATHPTSDLQTAGVKHLETMKFSGLLNFSIEFSRTWPLYSNVALALTVFKAVWPESGPSGFKFNAPYYHTSYNRRRLERVGLALFMANMDGQCQEIDQWAAEGGPR